MVLENIMKNLKSDKQNTIIDKEVLELQLLKQQDMISELDNKVFDLEEKMAQMQLNALNFTGSISDFFKVYNCNNK